MMLPDLEMPDDLEPPEGKYLSISKDLKQGDVLLSSGEFGGDLGWITWLIRKLDGEGYSHAAFFDGTYAIEAALGAGVKETSIKEAVVRNRYTDVYRFTKAGKQIGHPDWPYEPLDVKADSFLKCPYGQSDAILAAVLIVLRRRLSCPSGLARKILSVLLEATQAVRAIIEKKSASDTITCAELVYRIYGEAEPARKYSIEVELTRQFAADALISPLSSVNKGAVLEINVEQALAPGFVSKGESDEEALRGAINEFSRLYSELKKTTGLPFERTYLDSLANYVTPGDFRRSKTLVPIGRIQK